MTNLESLKASVDYVIHYIFDENNNLDYIYIGHSQKLFNEENQTLELTFDQFKNFPLNNDCYVEWGDTMTPNQWVEYWTESNRI
jgi:hypothetical protein